MNLPYRAGSIRKSDAARDGRGLDEETVEGSRKRNASPPRRIEEFPREERDILEAVTRSTGKSFDELDVPFRAGARSIRDIKNKRVLLAQRTLAGVWWKAGRPQRFLLSRAVRTGTEAARQQATPERILPGRQSRRAAVTSCLQTCDSPV
jgi:hypothetical protein